MANDITVYTLFSYEDYELKSVTSSKECAEAWIEENRLGNEEDIRMESWEVENND